MSRYRCPYGEARIERVTINMIFQFLTETEDDAVAVEKFVQHLSCDNLQNLPEESADTLWQLLNLPPHMLTLEDMVFCQEAVQTLWNAGPGRNHRSSVCLSPSVSVEDQNGCCVYFVPSAIGNKILRF